MPQWRNLSGTFPEWPTVVAILDCTPFRISKPKGLTLQSKYLDISLWLAVTGKWYGNIIMKVLSGVIQRLFYHKDRHAFF